jgi:hypothetical protein
MAIVLVLELIYLVINTHIYSNNIEMHEKEKKNKESISGSNMKYRVIELESGITSTNRWNRTLVDRCQKELLRNRICLPTLPVCI